MVHVFSPQPLKKNISSNHLSDHIKNSAAVNVHISRCEIHNLSSIFTNLSTFAEHSSKTNYWMKILSLIEFFNVDTAFYMVRMHTFIIFHHLLSLSLKPIESITHFFFLILCKSFLKINLKFSLFFRMNLFARILCVSTFILNVYLHILFVYIYSEPIYLYVESV